MKEFIFHNFRLKLMALVFAFALWFFVAGQSSTEASYVVPLVFKGVPEDMVMTSAPPADIEVRVVGPNFVVKNLQAREIKAEVDLGGAKEGINSFRVMPADIAVPIGIKVMKVLPGTFDARMERIMEMDLPVRVRLEGIAAPGYKVTGFSVIPKIVTASVVAGKVKQTEALRTRPIDINGINASKVVLAQLDVTEREFRSVNVYNVKVKITVEKEKQDETQKEALRH